MKILYDHQIFEFQKYGGISRYFYELIKEFKTDGDMKVITPLLVSNNHYISDKKHVPHVRWLQDINFRGRNRIVSIFNRLSSSLKIKKNDYGVFHPTYYDPYFLDYIGDMPFLVTVYDMIHEKFSEAYSPDDPVSRNKKLLVEKASKIIAISQSTKNDLIDLFDVEPSKIEVVYLGNSMVLKKNHDFDIEIPSKYILFVGLRSGYKNFNRFIESVSELIKNDGELSVVCVGGGVFSEQEVALFNKLNIFDRVYQYSLDDELLAQFYDKAELFVFPSLYEGFGIPVLEAFACNCPLVCSNTSSLPEIAGHGAEYFDPYDESSMREAIDKILSSDHEKDKLRKSGCARLKKFSWHETAKQTNKIYESLIR